MTITAQQPPVVSGEQDENGHLEELRTDPIALMQRVRDECGDIGSFRIGKHNVVLLTGAELQEWYFRAPDELLDQAAAYPFMTPIFGKGVVFDAPPERRREMLQNQALKGPQMRGHAETIAREVEEAVAPWNAPGEIDLLDWFSELTIYTSSACLIGPRFRESLDGRFARLYHDLERGTDPIAYIDPYAPIESFRKRDAARVQLVQLVEAIMDERRTSTADEEPDLLDILMSLHDGEGAPRFSSDEITGIFISMMFAGHHTTSGTAAWTLIELLRRPEEMAAVVGELDELYADGSSVSFQALRAIPRLESAIKEALRLHPPLILLLRMATEDVEVGGYLVKAGDLLAATPAISNRLPSDFPDAESYLPERYLDPRREDDTNPWTWIPFGGGKHRCVGAAFAMMQLKAIFSVLLQRFTFELAQPSDSYRNDHSKMVVQLQQPCRVSYRPRAK